MAIALGLPLIAQTTLTVQPAIAATSAVRPTKIVRRSLAQTGANQSKSPTPVIAAPISGYVTDPVGSVRPINGFGPFSVIGAALDLGQNFGAMIPSPNQNYLVELPADGPATLWVDISGDLGQIPFPADASGTSLAVPSPLGFSVALISQSRGIAQVFSSLPDSPKLAFSETFSDLGGVPENLAVSDDGSTLLYTLREGRQQSLRVIQIAGSPQFIDSGAFKELAFAPYSLDCAVIDSETNRLYLMHYANGQYSRAKLGAEDRDSLPVSLAFSRDGQQVLVANSGSGTIQSFYLDGSAGSTAMCECSPASLTRLTGNAVFQVTPFDGSSAAIFDGDVLPAVMVTVGPTDTPSTN